MRALMGANRVLTDRYEYDAWGNLLSSTGTTFNSYFYTGEQLDPTMGLYNLRARWYGPRAGRFATADKFEGSGRVGHLLAVVPGLARVETGEGLGPHHLYGYVENDAANGVDPSGFGFEERGIFWGRFASQFRRFKKTIDLDAIERICITAALLNISLKGGTPATAWAAYVKCKQKRLATFN